MRPPFSRLLVCCLLFTPNFACAKSEPPSPPVSTPIAAGIGGLSAKNYPRVNGSTSTIPLAQLLLAKALGLNAELRRGLPNEYSQTESTLLFSFARDTPPEKLKEFARLQRANAHTGTHESYEALLNGAADVILVARGPSPDELKLAEQKKIKLMTHPIARDALIFLVNKANGVRGLTSAQLRAIYGGQTTNWKTVGGVDEPIRAYTRDRNSGSEELARALLMKNDKMIEGGERVISSMAGLLDAVARNPRALGYSIFYYETEMNPREGNKTLAVDGVLPTRQTIADGTYPFVAPVYVVTRADALAGSPAAIVRDWLSGDDGQELVARSGYVPLP